MVWYGLVENVKLNSTPRMNEWLCKRVIVISLPASHWLFSTVNFQMSPRIACLRGCKVPLIAFVWLFSIKLSSASSVHLDQSEYLYIGCICFTFLHCAFQMCSLACLRWCNVTLLAFVWLLLCVCMTYMSIITHQWGKVKQMQPMLLCILKGRPFEETHDNTHWRKVEQMQPMWLCFLSGKQFEDTHDDTQWRNIKQMQPMWLCILSGRHFEETHENAQWGKVKQM